MPSASHDLHSGRMEYEYIVYVTDPGRRDIRRTYMSEVEVREGQVLNLDEMSVAVVEVVERPHFGQAGLIEADLSPQADALK